MLVLWVIFLMFFLLFRLRLKKGVFSIWWLVLLRFEEVLVMKMKEMMMRINRMLKMMW